MFFPFNFLCAMMTMTTSRYIRKNCKGLLCYHCRVKVFKLLAHAPCGCFSFLLYIAFPPIYKANQNVPFIFVSSDNDVIME